MELGSQVCKPTNPDCPQCPISSACKAYQDASVVAPKSTSETCSICSPFPVIPSKARDVTIYPMKKVPKAQREETTEVMMVKWEAPDKEQSQWLFVKRPDKGECTRQL